MSIYIQKQIWKLLLLFIAISIGIGSLLYTNNLVKKLAKEEKKKIEIWAEVQESIISSETLQIPELYSKVIEYNTTIPVLVVDTADNLSIYKNLDSAKISNTKTYNRILKKMKENSAPIEIVISPEHKEYLYFYNSTILTKLTYYPFVQLGVILLFILVSYFAFSYSRKAEQNKVWVGLSKETAHQLGTPLSSLMAWHEILDSRTGDDKMINELGKDIQHLEKITERFSKIGSKPTLTKNNVSEVILTAVNYLKTRTSARIAFDVDMPLKAIILPCNPSLFEWVIENVCKNAIDAIEGNGKINIKLMESHHSITIDINDNGKGIPKRKQKAVFKPGFTTKQRGWGLGLSLTKRIIEDYHGGKIYVHHSEVKKGTTIRIILNK